MDNFPSKNAVIKAILDGIINARKNFLYWTNDRLPLSYGPHKIITIHIAQEIALIENAPEIFIDATVSDILRCSLPMRDSFLEYMQKNSLTQGDFSITLDERCKHKNDNDSVSRVIIAIKSGVINSKSEYIDEIDRICKIIKIDTLDSSTLDYGVFAFYSDISNVARKKLGNRIPNIINNFDKVVANYKNLKSTFEGGDVRKSDDGGEWCAGCYIVEPV